MRQPTKLIVFSSGRFSIRGGSFPSRMTQLQSQHKRLRCKPSKAEAAMQIRLHRSRISCAHSIRGCSRDPHDRAAARPPPAAVGNAAGSGPGRGPWETWTAMMTERQKSHSGRFAAPNSCELAALKSAYWRARLVTWCFAPVTRVRCQGRGKGSPGATDI